MPQSIRAALSGLAAVLSLAHPPSSLGAQQPAPSAARLGASIDSIVRADLIGRGGTGASVVIARGVAATRSVPYGFGVYVRPTLGGAAVIITDGATPGFANENVCHPAESLSSDRDDPAPPSFPRQRESRTAVDSRCRGNDGGTGMTGN